MLKKAFPYFLFMNFWLVNIYIMCFLDITFVKCVNKKSAYIIRRSMKMDNLNDFYTNITTQNFHACVAECSKDSSCGTTSYEVTSQRCYMGTEDTTHEPRVDYYLATHEDWITASKIIYPGLYSELY